MRTPDVSAKDKALFARLLLVGIDAIDRLQPVDGTEPDYRNTKSQVMDQLQAQGFTVVESWLTMMRSRTTGYKVVMEPVIYATGSHDVGMAFSYVHLTSEQMPVIIGTFMLDVIARNLRIWWPSENYFQVYSLKTGEESSVETLVSFGIPEAFSVIATAPLPPRFRMPLSQVGFIHDDYPTASGTVHLLSAVPRSLKYHDTVVYVSSDNDGGWKVFTPLSILAYMGFSIYQLDADSVTIDPVPFVSAYYATTWLLAPDRHAILIRPSQFEQVQARLHPTAP